MSTIFEKLSQTAADFETCWQAFKSAEQQGKDITAAVASRIATDRAQADERTATLTAQSRDPDRPEIVRKLAGQELARMQGRTFGPTETEVAAFNTAMADARSALSDFATVKAQLRELFEEAGKEVKSMRAATLGNQSRDDDLARRWLEGVQQGFDRLVRKGGSSE